jgi:SAM-dependent methyltransferase
VLTDLSPGMVQAARESSARAGLNLHFGLADAARIPFPPASFEAVCAHFMLYHVPDLPQALSEIRRVLRPGGVLFAATIGEGHMGELFELAGKFRPDWKIIAGRPAFHLENGAARLAPFFERVERRKYADGLLVDRAGPLADYVLSTTNFADVPVTEAQRGEFKAYLLARIETGGPLRITKNSGMFLARKGAA